MKRKHGKHVVIVCISVMAMLMTCLLVMNLMVGRNDVCYFNLADLASPDIKKVLVDPKLVSRINSLVGGVGLEDNSLRITSGYRTSKHNKKVGGASRSYHTKGMAIDCYSPGICNGDLAVWALECGFTTAIIYPSHVHLDIREKGLGLRRNKGR